MVDKPCLLFVIAHIITFINMFQIIIFLQNFNGKVCVVVVKDEAKVQIPHMYEKIFINI